MPSQVANLLYAIEVKLLAVDVGIESIDTDDKSIVLRMVEGKQVDKALLEKTLGDGVKAGTNQVRLDTKRLGSRWRKALLQTLQTMAKG